jgi:ATP-dependent Clp protease ATP-binding subunit ClpA
MIDTVRKAAKASVPNPEDIALLRDRLRTYKYALSGLPESPRSFRLNHVQGKLVQKLVSPELPDYFNEQIFAQDQALQDLCARLQMEVLTRPLFQPIRYCAQGTPGIGKSESTAMLARLLGMPFVNIDAASIPDIYTGSAQLLGSGRGLVGSYQSGRLEQAAKHRIGAVVEVSDLDHANPAVRCALADLFLQVLETGEAQSASGAMFSCANLIFVFSMNLPNGQDEFVHRSLGYANKPDAKEVRNRIRKELKKIFSSAFVSRIGEPIIFNPLSGEALCKIVERACTDLLRSAAKNLNITYNSLSVSEDAAKWILASCSDLDLTSGARGIIEKSRTAVATALLDHLTDIQNQSVNSFILNTIHNNINLSIIK